MILRPGIRTLPFGVERYVVEGGQLIVVGIEAGDRLQLTDIEGRQVCELVAADAKGKLDAAILGHKATASA